MAAFSTLHGKKSDAGVSATDVVRSAATGMPIVGGLANKANAAINATLAPVVEPFLDKGPETLDQPTWTERFKKSLELQDKRDKNFAENHPIVDTAASRSVTESRPSRKGSPCTISVTALLNWCHR